VTGNFGNELHGFWGAGGPALESEIPSRVRAQTEPGTGAAGMDFGKVLKACGDGNYGSRGPSGGIGRKRAQRTQKVGCSDFRHCFRAFRNDGGVTVRISGMISCILHGMRSGRLNHGLLGWHG